MYSLSPKLVIRALFSESILLQLKRWSHNVFFFKKSSVGIEVWRYSHKVGAYLGTGSREIRNGEECAACFSPISVPTT